MSADILHLQLRRSWPDFSLGLAEKLVLDGVCALFGASGSGKTSLLRLIAGLDKPDAGRIVFGDQVWLDTDKKTFVPAHRRPVGYMFQDGRLLPHLTVQRNLAYAENRSRQRKAGYRPDDVLQALDLDPLLERWPDTLSGGETQRVALGRTLLTRPQLLLLDEPLAALDRKRKAEILPYLERVVHEFGLPTLYVSHSTEEVARLADRLLLLDKGHVAAHGPAAEIFARIDLQPLLGRFEAGALLDAKVEGHDEEWQLTRLTVNGEVLQMPMAARLKPGDQVRVRVRARDVALAVTKPQKISIRNVLTATINSIEPEPQGAYAEIALETGGQSLRARLTRAAVADLGLRPGSDVYVLIKSVSFDRQLI